MIDGHNQTKHNQNRSRIHAQRMAPIFGESVLWVLFDEIVTSSNTGKNAISEWIFAMINVDLVIFAHVNEEQQVGTKKKE